MRYFARFGWPATFITFGWHQVGLAGDFFPSLATECAQEEALMLMARDSGCAL